MQDWERIRTTRTDITDYVIHFTKFRSTVGENSWPDRAKIAKPWDVFKEILQDQHIRPTFARIRSKMYGTMSNTVRGPDPAVCLTEQPLSDVLITRRCAGGRYSGFGIAYHKVALYWAGGRPVFYGDRFMLGEPVLKGAPQFKQGAEVFTGGLPTELQYLFVRYEPALGHWGRPPVDFTWEREWRVKPKPPGLPIFLLEYKQAFKDQTTTVPLGALIVEKDVQLPEVRSMLGWDGDGNESNDGLFRLVSLETVERKTKEGDFRYARIETYPLDSR